MERYLKEGAPKLGFGLMRLPKNANGSIDISQTSEMVDMFLEAGQTYFDTAYVYDAGESEKAAAKALFRRHAREDFTIATKLNVHANGCRNEQDAKSQLQISMDRMETDYIDFYLLHAIGENNIAEYDRWGIWDFVKEAKAQGKIKHWGFSFHGSSALLERLLKEHSDAEFVQLQINYADWENPNVASRVNYDLVHNAGKPIVVMEPVKGGTLANPPKAVADILKGANPGVSLPSWAIRYVASLDGIMSVLSGMSNVAQMADNLSYMKQFRALNDQEQAAIRRAQAALVNVESIPCTACHYCTEGCPMGIKIPDIFAARNAELIWNRDKYAKAKYDDAVQSAGRASDCIGCGQCERACPQHIDIIHQLKQCASAYDS